MQLISRLMDHVLAKRAQRTTIVVATSGDTGGAAVDAFAGLDNVDLIVLFPNGRISDVQRRMMTTTGAANVHALAIEGTFDDCQAIVKALFNHHGFRDAGLAVGRQLDQLGADRGAGGVLFHVRGRARRARAHGGFHRADREFRRHLCRLRRQEDGPAGSAGCGSPPTSTTSCRARSRPASTRCARFTPPLRPRWTSRSPRISSGCCSRRAAATPTAFAG